MSQVAVNWFWCLAGAMATLVAASCGYAVYLGKRRTIPPAEAIWPRAVVLLPLRGADAYLTDNLRRLLSQDYPCYELHVVVDSASDPALPFVQAAAAESDRLKMSIIRRKLATCSPQCSALIQAVDDLPDDVEVVATIDGDVQTHESWLRELIAPLLESGVGAAHGNRWFLPRDAQWGALVRYLWIAASILPMHLFRYPWAGTFAVRRSALMQSGLFEHWSRSVVPDAPCSDYLRTLGLTVRFVPSLMMVNREGCSLRFCYDFIKRQMTWTRLYNRRFWPVVALAAAIAVVWAFTVGLIVHGIATAAWNQAAWSAASLLVIVTATIASVAALEQSVRAIAR